MLGMYLGLRALQRGGQLYASILVFAAALFTKQTVVIGAIATLLIALCNDWRRTVRAALVVGTLAVVAFAALTIMTAGGFVRHVILYNINRFSMSAALDTFLAMSWDNLRPVYSLTAGIGLCAIMLRGITTGWRVLPLGKQIVAVYAILVLISLVSLGKTGSSSNYFIPVMCASAILIGLAVADGALWASRSQRNAIGFAALLGVLIAQTLMVPPVGEQRLTDPSFRREYAELVKMVRDADKPVLSENMVLLMEAGSEVPWEPAIITELSATKVFDEQKAITLINSNAFAFVVVKRVPATSPRDERSSLGVRMAIERAYPAVKMLVSQPCLAAGGPH